MIFVVFLLFVGIINGRLNEVMILCLNNILVVLGFFFIDIEIIIFVNVLRSECEMEMDDVKSD